MIVALYVDCDAKLPDVVAYLEHDRDHSCLNLVVKNVGKGVACNITINSFDYSIVDANMTSLLKQSFIKRGFPCWYRMHIGAQ